MDHAATYIDPYGVPWRRGLRRLVTHPIFGALLWNPLWKANRRLWGHPQGRQVNPPQLNGAEDVRFGVSADGVFMVLGWGWLTGFAVELRDGVTHFPRPLKGHRLRRTRRFGRITITRKS